jgi:hypothetical protein
MKLAGILRIKAREASAGADQFANFEAHGVLAITRAATACTPACGRGS